MDKRQERKRKQMRIYKSDFRAKPDLYYVMDTRCKKLRKFIEWLWFRIEY